MTIPVFTGKIPWVTTEQMILVDRAMMKDFRIELIQMMENAGRNLAHLARVRFLDGNPKDREVVVLAGTGGNGGGAMVCARRLHNWGAKVQVFVTKPAKAFTPIPAHQLEILQRMSVPVARADMVSQVESPALIVDGIIGYSLKGPPGGKAADLIRWANDQKVPVLSLDAPSGIDTTTGTVFDPAISATATMTLALPKVGLRGKGVAAQSGELYLGDISVPPSLYGEPGLGLQVGHLFAGSEIIRIR